ncbi:MAG: histidine kinase, partial [Cyclobacteriaceae bacterium]
WLYLILIRFDYLERNHDYHERRRQAITDELAQTRLQALRSQLNPHFLYNAMNSIAMMVRTKKYGESIEMVANLNELLRISLDRSGEQLVTLERELEILDRYLQVELMRFRDRVSIDFAIAPDTLSAKVPQLILQPLVENAFKHGMSHDLGKQNISVVSEHRNNLLKLLVVNSTAAHTMIDLSFTTESNRTGLQNIKDRLRQLYGGQFKFQVEQPAGKVAFRIIIPYET